MSYCTGQKKKLKEDKNICLPFICKRMQTNAQSINPFAILLYRATFIIVFLD